MSFDLSGPRAKREPMWIPCGGDMIAHVKKPNMRLKLVAGKWRSVAASRPQKRIEEKNEP